MDLINDFDCDGYRPIHHAILANSMARAKELVELGANINAPTESGDGALVLLCRALKDIEASLWVETLVQWGARLNDVDRRGWSALHHAVDRDLTVTAARLLHCGVDPSLKNSSGQTARDLSRSAAVKALFDS